MTRGQTEERRAYMRAWHAANPRDRKEYRAAYRAANKHKEKAYRDKTKDRRRQMNAKWYLANRERILARVKKRSEEKRAEILAYQSAYYAQNTDKVKARVRAYSAAFPEKKAQLEIKRRARKAGNGGSHTWQERAEKFERLGNVCFYCKAETKLTVDHDIPLKRGGTDDIENILPACRPCNSRKNTRTAVEFIEHLCGAP